MELGLGGVATGPVDRVWYSEDGSTLFARTILGLIYSTSDMETWTVIAGDTKIPETRDAAAPKPPEPQSKIRLATRGRLYAAGNYVYRSEDQGVSWNNLTMFRGTSILGGSALDLAVSPRDSEDVTIAGVTGVWRSTDGGLTWNGLNAGLPNLTFDRILATPIGVTGLRLSLFDHELEWAPGERSAWREPAKQDAALAAEVARNTRLSAQFSGTVTTSIAIGEIWYAGLADGRLASSADRGATWTYFQLAETGRVERIVADPADPRVALAAIGARPSTLSPQIRGAHVLRTASAGRVWDDLTSDLPDAAIHGLSFEKSSGAIYVAGDKGVFWTATDLIALGPPPTWRSLNVGLPGGMPAVDVRLDSGANQVYAGVLGFGVFATTAPHRRGSPRLAIAADYSSRPAAPGSLLTVFGSSAVTAVSGRLRVPVLASSESRSEIQIPFEARPGGTFTLSLDSGRSTLQLGFSIESASPAIFVERDGTPMLYDSDSGVQLNSVTGAHAGGRLQILSSGLGRVNPEWPTGTPAPAENPPAVAGVVRAYLDGAEAGVIRSVLAPGYVGFYLVEVQLPSIVNYGPAELLISVDGKESNRVRVYVEP